MSGMYLNCLAVVSGVCEATQRSYALYSHALGWSLLAQPYKRRVCRSDPAAGTGVR